MAGLQTASFQPAIIKWLMKCGHQRFSFGEQFLGPAVSRGRPLGEPATPQSISLTDGLIGVNT